MAVFEVNLQDNTSAPAQKAAGAVGGLIEEFERLQKSLADVEALQGKALAGWDKQAYKSPSESSILDDIKKQQQASLAGHDQDRDAAAGLKKQQDAAKETSKAFEDLTSSSDSLDEALSALGASFGVVGEAALLVAAVVAAVVTKIWDLAAAAVALSQEKDALSTTFGVLTGQGTEAGRQLIDDLGDLAAEMPFVGGQLEGWAKKLLAAGIQGEELKESIRAIAAATAIMGESGGAAAEGLIKRFAMMAAAGQKITLDRRILNQMAEAGLSVQALAKELGVAPDKLGKMQVGAKELGDAMRKALIVNGEEPMKHMANTWPSIMSKLEDGWEDLWEDLGPSVEPLMAEIRSLASEFFAGSAAGEQAKGVITEAFGAIFEVAKDAVNSIHKAFLYLQIASLHVQIALKPITSRLSELGIGVFFLKWGLVALVWIFGLLALVVFMALAPFLMLGALITAVIVGLVWLGAEVVNLVSGVIEHWDNLTSFASEAGSNLITALGDSIASGAQWVWDLAANLATGIKDKIKGALGIASPSRVMLQLGAYTTAGLAMGLDRGAGEVEAAAGRAGSAAVSGTTGAIARGGAQGGAPGGGEVKFELRVEPGAIVINGGGPDVRGQVEEAFAALMERLAMMVGAAVQKAST